jgi:hypothetical protein
MRVETIVVGDVTVVAYVIVVGLVTYMVEQYKSTATIPSTWRFRSP